MRCCFLTYSEVPRLPTFPSPPGGFQTPKGEFGAETELKLQQDLCSGRPLLRAPWRAPGTYHVPHHPARSDPRPGSITLPRFSQLWPLQMFCSICKGSAGKPKPRRPGAASIRAALGKSQRHQQPKVTCRDARSEDRRWSLTGGCPG